MPSTPNLRPDDHSGRVDIARLVAPNVVATAGEFGEVRFWSTNDAKPIRAESKHSERFVLALAVSDDRTTMFSCSHELLYWDLAARPIKSRFLGKHGGYQLGDVAILPDQRTVAVASAAEAVCLFDVSSGDSSFLFHRQAVKSVLSLPDGKHLISASREAKLGPSDEGTAVFSVWDLDSESVVGEANLPTPVTQLVVLENGRTVFYGSESGKLVWWDYRSARPNRIVQAYDGEWVDSLQVSADGKLAITAGKQTADVWRIRGGKQVTSFQSHTDSVGTACFLDKYHAVSGSRDGSIRVWRVTDGKEVAAFRDLPEKRKKIACYLDDPWEIKCVATDAFTIVAGEASGRIRILRFDGDKLQVLR